MNNPKDNKARDKAWEHVTQRNEQNGKNVFICNFCGIIIRGGGINRVKKHLAGRKGEIAPCTLVDPDVRLAIQASLEETDQKRKDKVTSSNVDVEEQEVTLPNKGIHYTQFFSTRTIKKACIYIII